MQDLINKLTIELHNYVNKKYPNTQEWKDNSLVLIEEDQIDYDSEKGFVDYECIVKRTSDGKFFKFIYTQFGHNGNNLSEQIAKEVYPKTKVITYYE